MRNHTVALLLITLSLHTTSALSETYCMWSINEPKGKMNEDGMKAPCDRKEVKGTKNYSEEYVAQGRHFKIEYLGVNNGLKQKVKINGKIGTASEENRYSKSITTDDLTIDFTYDEVLPDPSLSLAKLQGIWVPDMKNACKPDEGGNYYPDTTIIKGKNYTRSPSESVCSIYSLGKTTVGDFSMALMNCDTEGDKDKAMIMYELSKDGRRLSVNGMPSLSRCQRK